MNRFKIRPLSYSQLSSFEYDKEQWYDNYILGIKPEPNAAMLLGNKVGDSIGTPHSLVPDLVPPGVKEFELRANLGNIFIVGYCDHYCADTRVLHENKTTSNTKKWNQKSVDEHGQLTMYALMLFLQHKVPPKDVRMFLNYIPVELGNDHILRLPEKPVFYQFETKRSNLQIAEYANYIKEMVAKMDEYIKERES